MRRPGASAPARAGGGRQIPPAAEGGSRVRPHHEEPAVRKRATLVRVAWPEGAGRGEACATRVVLPDRTEVHAYRADDGAWVVELDTGSCADEAMADADGVPYARVYVNDGAVYEHGPPGPLPAAGTPGGPTPAPEPGAAPNQQRPIPPGGGRKNPTR